MTLVLLMNLGFAASPAATPVPPTPAFTFGHRSGPIVPGSDNGRAGPIVHVVPKREM